MYVEKDVSSDKHIYEKVQKASSMFAITGRILNYLDKNIFLPLDAIDANPIGPC